VCLLGSSEKWYVSSSPCQVSGRVARRSYLSHFQCPCFLLLLAALKPMSFFVISLVNIYLKVESMMLCCQFITGHEALSPLVGISLVIGFWTGCIFPFLVEWLYHYVSSFVNPYPANMENIVSSE